MTSARLAPPLVPQTLPPGAALFENRLLAPGAGTRLFLNPHDTITAATLAEVTPALQALDRALDEGLWAAGFVSFEAGYALEPRLMAQQPDKTAPGPLPLLRFALFKTCQMISAREADQSFSSAIDPGHRLSPLSPSHSRPGYGADVERALDLITAGDAYQVNLTFPMTGHLEGNPLSLYAALRARQPVAHGAAMRIGEIHILSVSPELFVTRQGDRLSTRPMKGTIARGTSPSSDALAKATLRASAKDRAENLMIVDLLRNDLARVCRAGSVRVPRLYELETYPTLHTLTSTIVGDVEGHLATSEILSALFPCGSVTGAPKIRAMEIIQEIEKTPRGAYTGALGWIAPWGDFSFNVAIRTMTVEPSGRVTYPVGAGIVADSDPSAEYDECLLKAKAIQGETTPFSLIETLEWQPRTGFTYLEPHLDRLERSARHFSFTYTREGVRKALDAEVGRNAGGTRLRVRLTLAADGAIATSASALPSRDAAAALLKFTLSDQSIDAGDPYLRHKTTRREVFDHALALAQEQGSDEVLFCNQYGELTEGAWTSVFIDPGDGGALLTPPMTSGLLPGILRADLIAAGKAVERVLTLQDLHKAKAVVLGNSVRGLMPARHTLRETSKKTAESLSA